MNRSTVTTHLPIAAAGAVLATAVGMFGYVSFTGDDGNLRAPAPISAERSGATHPPGFVCPESRTYPPSAC